jgi:hypothetical protein
MGIQSFVPAGGGGTPGFDYIASIRMETYNRSWAQGGAAGNYILTSNNFNSGYVYFVGNTTTGGPLGKVVNVSHAFTSINVIAPTGDFMSLYKAAVKSTTVFANPFALFSSFPSQITSSGNFVLPTSALPLVDALIVGGGAGGGGSHAGGGGGGAAVIKLTGYQAVGTTSITIGGGGSHDNTHGYSGGSTYFGNVFAISGTGGSGNSRWTGENQGANGGGANGHSRVTHSDGIPSGSAHISKVTAGFGTQSGTASYVGGNPGGNFGGSHAGGGGGGAGATGGNGSGASPGGGGAGHTSNITGSNVNYGAGGAGGSHSPNNGIGGHPGGYGSGGHGAHNGPDNNASGGGAGIVVVRYYIA